MGELLTLQQVAALLNFKPETVRRLWILTGKLRATRIGYQWRVDADDIPAAIALKNREREARVEALRKRRLEAKTFADLNATIAPGGECTVPSQQDQMHRQTGDAEFYSPLDEA